jgi:hypothetical protein
MLGSADYTATNGTSVVLASGASAGDLVAIESFYVSSVLTAIPNTANAVNSLLISDGAITQSKLGTNVVGNGPAFSVYKSTNQTVTSGVSTKVTYDTEVFDTASCYDPATSRFTPNVAGYYQINATIAAQSSTTLTIMTGLIYKNGTEYRYGVLFIGISGNRRANISDLIYMNGTTDYLEIYSRGDGATVEFVGGAAVSSFSGFLVRAA